MTDQIFISYSKKDRDFAHKLADDLTAAGFKIWIDRSLQVGEDWEDTIENQIRVANEVIVILSPNAVSSKWVQHEGSIAYGLDKKMFPVLLESIPSRDQPLWAKKFQYHSFVKKEYQDAFDALVAAFTPPNPIQDLLDQQVQAYQQTGELIGEAILRVIDENRETLKISTEAQELIAKSQQTIADRQQREQQLLAEKEATEKQRLAEQAIANQKLRRRAAILTIAFVFAVAALLFAIAQSTRNAKLADDNASIAETAQANAGVAFSRQLATLSQKALEEQLDQALLLAVESYEAATTTLALESLISVLNDTPSLIRFISPSNEHISDMAFSPDGKWLVTVGCQKNKWGACDEQKGSILIHNIATGQISQSHTVDGEFFSYVAFSSNGKILAVGSNLEKIYLWDFTNNQLLDQNLWDCSFTSSGTYVEAKYSGENLSFSPNGKVLAFRTNSGLCLWDAEKNTSTLLHYEQMPDFDPMIPKFLGSNFEFLPDGKILVYDYKSGVSLWDGFTGDLVDFWEPALQDELTFGSLQYAFSPNFSLNVQNNILATSTDYFIDLWDLRSGDRVAFYNPADLMWEKYTVSLDGNMVGYTDWLSFSPDGMWMTSFGSDGLILWDLDYTLTSSQDDLYMVNGWLVYDNLHPQKVVFSPDSRIFATLSQKSDQILLWKVNEIVGILDTFSPHQLLYKMLTLTSSGMQFFFSDDGKLLAAVECKDFDCSQSRVRLWEINGNHPREIFTYQLPDRDIIEINFSLDASKMGIVGCSNWVRAPVFVDYEDEIYDMGLEFPNEHWNRTCMSGEINVWDIIDKHLILEIPFDNLGIQTAVFSPDGNVLSIAGCGKMDLEKGCLGVLELWSLDVGKPLDVQFEGIDGMVIKLAFSPDGDTLVSGDCGHTDSDLLCSTSGIMVWDVQTGQLQNGPIVAHEIDILSLVFSPDGNRLITLGCDQLDRNPYSNYSPYCAQMKTRLWDLNKGQVIGQHFNASNEMLFSADGSMLIDRRNLELWDVDTQQLLGFLHENRGYPYSGFNYDVFDAATYLPENSLITIGKDWYESDEKILIFWDLNPSSWSEQACQRAGRNFTQAEWQQYFPDEEYRLTCPQWPAGE